MATGTRLDRDHARQLLATERTQSGTGNTGVPSGVDGVDMGSFGEYVRAVKYMVTLALEGGAPAVFEVWGRRPSGSVWGSIDRLNSGSPLDSDKTYHFIVHNVGLFDRVAFQCVSGAPASWSATIIEIFTDEET